MWPVFQSTLQKLRAAARLRCDFREPNAQSSARARLHFYARRARRPAPRRVCCRPPFSPAGTFAGKNIGFPAYTCIHRESAGPAGSGRQRRALHAGSGPRRHPAPHPHAGRVWRRVLRAAVARHGAHGPRTSPGGAGVSQRKNLDQELFRTRVDRSRPVQDTGRRNGDRADPVSRQGRPEGRSYKYISAVDVINERVEVDELQEQDRPRRHHRAGAARPARDPGGGGLSRGGGPRQHDRRHARSQHQAEAALRGRRRIHAAADGRDSRWRCCCRC